MSAAGAATFNSDITAVNALFKEGNSGAAATSGSANNLVLENSSNAGLTIATPADGIASIFYSDPDSNAAGYLQYNHSTNLHTIFSTGDIALDAGNDTISLKDSGTQFGEFISSSTDFVIKSSVSDKDIIFKGNDGGSAITALTLDMSDGGTAIFGSWQKMADSNRIVFGAGSDMSLFSDGTDGNILVDGDLSVDVAGDIILDADGGDIFFKNGGTAYGNFLLSGTDFTIGSSQNNGDLIFRGIGGGSDVTALTLDMSAGGDATFAAKVNVGENLLMSNNYEIRFKDSGGTERTAIELDNSNNFVVGTSASGVHKFVGGGGYIERFRINTDGSVVF